MKKAIKFLIILFIIIIGIIIVYINVINKDEKQENNLDNYEIETHEIVSLEKKEKYECNEFNIVNITTENLVLIYFNKYKNYLISNPEMAYELINEEYRKKRFGSLTEYEEFVKENLERLSNISLESYKIDNSNFEYNRYICTDSYGDYYIFNEYAIMDFEIILDTYTLDLPEFLEKYDKANDEGKCALNIQKFMQAINSKDYNYAYDCLADSFKNNYFKSISDFKKYIEENLFENNNVDYTKFEEKSGLLTYKIEISDTKNNSNYIEKTIIMQLNEGTDFELSFDV